MAVWSSRSRSVPTGDRRHLRAHRTDGAGRCARTDAEADLSGSVNVLGATYLGGTSFHQLARAGQVDRAFGGRPRPRRRDVLLDAGSLVRRRLLTLIRPPPSCRGNGPFASCAIAQRRDRVRGLGTDGGWDVWTGEAPPFVGGSCSWSAWDSCSLPGVLGTGPAAAHTFTKNDGNDSPGKLDLRAVSVSHTSTAVVHKVKTYDAWTPRSLGNDSFFIIQIDKNNDRPGRLRALRVHLLHQPAPRIADQLRLAVHPEPPRREAVGHRREDHHPDEPDRQRVLVGGGEPLGRTGSVRAEGASTSRPTSSPTSFTT